MGTLIHSFHETDIIEACMHIGILKTDTVRPEWVGEYGEYPDMFKRLLNEAQDGLRFSVWDAEAGVLPNANEIDSVCGFIITGSKSSVYDDKQWIRDLEVLICDLHTRRKKMVGICFGHQLIARALGGLLAKSDKGWGVGIHCYDIDALAFDEQPSDSLKLVVSHQDQVLTLPPGAQTVVRNDHCEHGGFLMGDHVLTLQGHPEFIDAYSEEIMAFRYDMIGAKCVAKGRESLIEHDHEGDRVARWMLNFLAA